MRAAVRLTAFMLVVLVAAPCAVVRAQTVGAASVVADSTSEAAFIRLSPRVAASDSAIGSTIDVPAVQPGAPLTGLRAGVHARETSRPDHVALAPSRVGLGQARAMMIVGAAALVAGAIIGDTPGTIIMVGGAVIGLVGLYDYLQ